MSVLVKYEGDELSVVEKPPRDCQAVITARDDMLRTVDLDGFLSNLVYVGKFIRIAFNGVAGDTHLQITVRELGLEIAELCDDSGLTMDKFRTTADSYVTRLTGAYHFFLDDMEEMAITSIESVEDSGKQMAEAAEVLCKRFKDEKAKVLGVCQETARKKGMEQDYFRELKVKRKVTQCCNKEMIVREQTIVALHGAVGALSNLATIMQKAAAFWKAMQQMCEEQSNGKLEALLETAKKYEDPVKRLKVYQNAAVKKRAIKMYMPWVAMETVCDDYIKKIKVSREELYSYLSENPTIEESRTRIKLLCREFVEEENAELEKRIKQIKEDNQRWRN